MLVILIFSLFVTSAFGVGTVEVIEDPENNAKLAELGKFAVSELYGETASKPTSIRVVNATKQLVAGENYFLSLEITYPNNKVLNCDATIFTQAWTHTRRLVHSDCPRVVGKRKASVSTKLSPTDPHVQLLAKYATAEVGKVSSCLKQPRLESVDQVTEVDGVYTVDMTLCEWPFSSSGRQIRIPHPCALRDNLHGCRVIVQTKNGIPVHVNLDVCSRC